MTPTAAAVGGGSANVALNAATLVMLNQLSARLERCNGVPLLLVKAWGTAISVATEARQGHQTWMPWRPPVAPWKPGEAMPAKSIPQGNQAAGLDLPLGNPENMCRDPRLHLRGDFRDMGSPDTVKTAGRLQIPLLKLSLFDQALFSNNQHLPGSDQRHGACCNRPAAGYQPR